MKDSREWICLCGVEHSLIGEPELIECAACGARYVPARLVKRLSGFEAITPDPPGTRESIEAFGQWYSYEHRN